MELELNKIQYTKIGTTFPNCLKLLPDEYKKQQKIVLADLDGRLYVFFITKNKFEILFQTEVGKRISTVQLGGAKGILADKIFVATEHYVKGYNRKGKMFLSFDTNLMEHIKNMAVIGSDLIVCGNHVYNHFRDFKDIGSYLCGDTIVDMVALCPTNTTRIITILACSGRVLRVLEHCRVRSVIEVDSFPTVLHVPKSILGDQIMCGFTDGSIILINFSQFANEPKKLILVKPDLNLSAVTCFDTFDITGDNNVELLIGRRNGIIQVLRYTLESDFEIEPEIIYSNCFSESIYGIQGGYVSNKNIPEIIAVTYSGNIFGLTTKSFNTSLDYEHGNEISVLSNTQNSRNEDTNNPISNENLLTYQQSKEFRALHTFSSSAFELNDSITLNKENGIFNLFLELPVAISSVIIQAEIPIEIIYPENNNLFTVENNTTDLSTGFNFATKFQIKNIQNKFEINYQTIEGQYGNIELYVIPTIQPHNIQLKNYMIHPLSLHIRCHTFDNNRPLNELILKGSFSKAEIHCWLEKCISETPVCCLDEIETKIIFENVIVGTVLECKYMKGFAQFQSDNISTISIIKDFLTKEATKKRIKLEITTNISEASIEHFLSVLEPKLMKCLDIKNDYKWLKALLEVNIKDEDDFNLLMPNYRAILKKREQIETEFLSIPLKLNRFFGLITDLYIDRYKFKGIFVKKNIPELVNILENYNREKVLQFFNNSSVNVQQYEINKTD